MCGIAGVAGPGVAGEIDIATLTAMCDAIRSRGPDDSGYAAHPDAKLVAVCDPDEIRAQAAVTEFGCAAYSDMGEMLKAEAPDIVSIAVPNFLLAQEAARSVDVLFTGVPSEKLFA